MARIVFDLDGTLVGEQRRGRKTGYALNKSLVGVAKKLRAQGHTIILWTFGNRRWWREVRHYFPVLKRLFHEVYTRDEMPGHVTRGVREHYGVKVPFCEAVKDIRLINGDVLIDNEPAHHEWAKRHGLARKYVLVRNFGVA